LVSKSDQLNNKSQPSELYTQPAVFQLFDTKMPPSHLYDVVVVGGGAVGLGATYEVAKSGKSVLVLEQNCFFNGAGSSNDLARMYRTM